MKKRYTYLISICALFSTISLTSCRTILDYYKGVTIDIDTNISNGSISAYYEKNEINNGNKIQLGDKLYIKTLPDEGYMLDELYINNRLCNDTPYFTVEKDYYMVRATFKPITYSNDNLKEIDAKLTHSDIYNSKSLAVTPSTGDVKILVVPIEFNDYDGFTQSELNSIRVSFNGNKIDNSNDYWESLSSFYKKSSYGKLNLSFDICDKYIPSFSGSDFKIKEQKDGEGSIAILDECRDKLTINSNKVNYKDYDSNKDGYVDGVWFIYNAKDQKEVYDERDFWAYVYSCVNDDKTGPKYAPDLDNPQFARYANCSQLFLYSDSEQGFDAHTLIHEQGHMFGLDDYYTYDDSVKASGTGGLDMMDLNVGDHNAFNKFSLGWIKPKVITSVGEFKLKPISSSGEALILPTYKDINNPFNEYYIIEYYTNDNLYQLDSTKAYRDVYPRYFKDSGIRITHIDARLIDVRDNFINSNELSIDGINYPLDENKYYDIACSNTASRSYKKTKNDLGYYNLIETLNILNKKSYNSFYYDTDGYSFLFKVGDVLNSNLQSNFFINNVYNHDGSLFNYSLRVEGLNKEYASISVKIV